ncbi:ABC transporter substrate-binding protein [Paenibacillus sp. 481]|uniref:ABC transporter substrate-binding protein n=1 Tax=Paenibacillus sp. 481 TaxID=2835869 RepID=UPI001E64BCD8|nr:ABC transporter substrate-binding protein [Paenibacillus sp. 481]UHA72103.1 ABC transporter substrate-binding protein [Paenibacillus sp. 481]
MNMSWSKIGTTALVLLMAVSLAACGQPKTVDNKAAEQQGQGTGAGTTAGNQEQAKDQQLKTTYPLKIKDSTGKEFTFEKAPERIISVAPSDTEALFAIGLGDKIVGVSDHDDYPAEAAAKPKMGGLEPNVEAIVAAKADIIFAGALGDATIQKYRDLGLNMIKLEAKTYDGIMKNIETYGLITDHQQQAKAVVDKMSKTRADIQAAVTGVKEKKKVFIEFSPGWTVGKGEYMHDMIELAGGMNVAASEEGWIEMSEEKIVKSNPDVILYGEGVEDFKTKQKLKDIIQGRSGWSGINAMKNNQVIGLADDMISRPGPRAAEALHAIAKAIYPELVK